ncbi:MAG: HEAT repeat domain-containing protein [Halobacteriales archaeon]
MSTFENHCTGTPRERAAATRVLYVTEFENIASVGVDLLLGNSPSPFSVFGIDTLYRVAETDPEPLFARAAADYRGWDPALQAQVLLVARRLNTVVGDADLSWVVDLADSPAERTRIEAIRTLGGFGWRQPLRDQVDVDALTSDPSPAVRTSVYRTLGEWGDQDATDALLKTVADETDKRARFTAAQELVGHCDDDVIPESLSDAWSWASEHARFDRLARDVSTSRQSMEVEDG